MNMYPQMETPGGTCTPKQKYEWACCVTVYLKIIFLFLKKTYVSGTQKNPLNHETVLLRAQIYV